MQLTCSEAGCNNKFILTAAEQESYERKGSTDLPQCPACREKKGMEKTVYNTRFTTDNPELEMTVLKVDIVEPSPFNDAVILKLFKVDQKRFIELKKTLEDELRRALERDVHVSLDFTEVFLSVRFVAPDSIKEGIKKAIGSRLALFYGSMKCVSIEIAVEEELYVGNIIGRLPDLLAIPIAFDLQERVNDGGHNSEDGVKDFSGRAKRLFAFGFDIDVVNKALALARKYINSKVIESDVIDASEAVHMGCNFASLLDKVREKVTAPYSAVLTSIDCMKYRFKVKTVGDSSETNESACAAAKEIILLLTGISISLTSAEVRFSFAIELLSSCLSY
jgi:hypothetical protein